MARGLERAGEAWAGKVASLTGELSGQAGMLRGVGNGFSALDVETGLHLRSLNTAIADAE
ncbi:hypothetical protein [Streptomyces sp. RFCAC02]|uniref:hypothetical protein n=1 Tax=Streptomyces sp. RFCAC02 TaxID=2499143 RepID=UPI0010209AAB|nr:hypothetical protein [Streptomyces sp. RFCAC02]